jgi:hypothetical protein
MTPQLVTQPIDFAREVLVTLSHPLGDADMSRRGGDRHGPHTNGARFDWADLEWETAATHRGRSGQ